MNVWFAALLRLHLHLEGNSLLSRVSEDWRGGPVALCTYGEGKGTHLAIRDTLSCAYPSKSDTLSLAARSLCRCWRAHAF